MVKKNEFKRFMESIKQQYQFIKPTVDKLLGKKKPNYVFSEEELVRRAIERTLPEIGRPNILTGSGVAFRHGGKVIKKKKHL